MTRQEKRESFKTYMGISHIGTWGFMICIILVGLTSMIKFAFIGCLIMGASLIIGQLYYTGGKVMFNPLRVLQDLREKQDALIKYLGLEAILVPRHWTFKKLEPSKG